MTAEVIEAEVLPVKHETPGLTLSQGSPREIVDRATEMADTLRKVIREKGLFSAISGREYVRVEGWTTLGAMVGVFPKIEWTRPIEDAQRKKLGWEARCVVATPAGQVVGAGEAECTYDERNWADRDDYALRSMAQTRAVSKAMRLPLSWVITLAGFEATPAEEVPSEGFQRPSGGRERPSAAKPVPQTVTSKMWGLLYQIYDRETQREEMLDFLGDKFPDAMSERNGQRFFNANDVTDAELLAFVKDLEAIA